MRHRIRSTGVSFLFLMFALIGCAGDGEALDEAGPVEHDTAEHLEEPAQEHADHLEEPVDYFDLDDAQAKEGTGLDHPAEVEPMQRGEDEP